MRNTVSWSCAFCGEYNVAELKHRPAASIRCGFCFQPLQSFPALEPGKPRMRLSDAWIGDELVKPLFGDTERGDGDGK